MRYLSLCPSESCYPSRSVSLSFMTDARPSDSIWVEPVFYVGARVRRNRGRLPSNGFIERAPSTSRNFTSPRKRAPDKALTFISRHRKSFEAWAIMLRLDGVTQLGAPVNSADGVRVAACPLARRPRWSAIRLHILKRDEGCDTGNIRFAAPGSLAVMAFPAP